MIGVCLFCDPHTGYVVSTNDLACPKCGMKMIDHDNRPPALPHDHPKFQPSLNEGAKQLDGHPQNLMLNAHPCLFWDTCQHPDNCLCAKVEAGPSLFSTREIATWAIFYSIVAFSTFFAAIEISILLNG